MQTWLRLIGFWSLLVWVLGCLCGCHNQQQRWYRNDWSESHSHHACHSSISPQADGLGPLLNHCFLLRCALALALEVVEWRLTAAICANFCSREQGCNDICCTSRCAAMLFLRWKSLIYQRVADELLCITVKFLQTIGRKAIGYNRADWCPKICVIHYF